MTENKYLEKIAGFANKIRGAAKDFREGWQSSKDALQKLDSLAHEHGLSYPERKIVAIAESTAPVWNTAVDKDQREAVGHLLKHYPALLAGALSNSAVNTLTNPLVAAPALATLAYRNRKHIAEKVNSLRGKTPAITQVSQSTSSKLLDKARQNPYATAGIGLGTAGALGGAGYLASRKNTNHD